MKKRVLTVALVLVAIITTSIIQARNRPNAIMYTDNVLPGLCINAASMPENCNAPIAAEICSIKLVDIVRTWYRDANCTLPFYRFPM